VKRTVNDNEPSYYTLADIQKLQKEIRDKLVKMINKEDSSRRFDLNLTINNELFLKLSTYNKIITKMIKCSSCNNYNLSPNKIFSVIKTTVNKI